MDIVVGFIISVVGIPLDTRVAILWNYRDSKNKVLCDRGQPSAWAIQCSWMLSRDCYCSLLLRVLTARPLPGMPARISTLASESRPKPDDFHIHVTWL